MKSMQFDIRESSKSVEDVLAKLTSFDNLVIKDPTPFF